MKCYGWFLASRLSLSLRLGNVPQTDSPTVFDLVQKTVGLVVGNNRALVERVHHHAGGANDKFRVRDAGALMGAHQTGTVHHKVSFASQGGLFGTAQDLGNTGIDFYLDDVLTSHHRIEADSTVPDVLFGLVLRIRLLLRI